MKYLVIVLALAVIVAGGCPGSNSALVVDEGRIAYNVGSIAVYAAYRAEAVTKIELAAARPYLVMLRDCLAAEPAEVSVILADFAAAESARWGIGLEDEDARIAVDIVVNFFGALRVEDPSIDAEQAADLAVQTLDGMLHAIDILLG